MDNGFELCSGGIVLDAVPEHDSCQRATIYIASFVEDKVAETISKLLLDFGFLEDRVAGSIGIDAAAAKTFRKRCCNGAFSRTDAADDSHNGNRLQ